MAPPVQEVAEREMYITTPNPRRTPPRTSPDMRKLEDGRKRRKVNHSPEKDSQVQVIGDEVQATGDEVPQARKVLHNQDSSSSDQSASKWFDKAAHGRSRAQKQPAEIDGTSRTVVAYLNSTTDLFHR